jgi:KipI family sensor histidine kinase inhibitor
LSARFTLRPAGPRALLIEFESLQQVRDYYAEAQLRRADGRLPSSVELVPAARTLLVDEVDDCATLARELSSWRPQGTDGAPAREVELPAVYDGPDLPDVAEFWGISPAEVIERHIALPHEVAFLGFAPGFAYLAGIPPELSVPRRPQPRTRVPIGSIALGAQFTGVYPRESPGGWQLIGRTAVPMWDPSAEPAAFLLPGDRVRFVPVAP